jgi:hypothetical protein
VAVLGREQEGWLSAQQKLAVVKKYDHESEFETLLRQTAEFMKTRRPQIVPKRSSPGRLPVA